VVTALVAGVVGCNQPAQPAPTELTAEALRPYGEAGIKLTWQPLDPDLGVVELVVERRDFDGTDSPETIATLAPSATEYIDEDPEPGIRWRYDLSARTEPGGEAQRIAVYAIARTADDEDPPAPPTELKVEDRALDQPAGIDLTWESSADEMDGDEDVVGYHIYRGMGGGAAEPSGGELIAALPAQFQSHVDEEVAAGQEYRYWVSASDGVNESEAAESATVVAVDNSTDVLKANLINYLRTIIALAFTLGLAITAHEFGHMMFAKWSGMKVDEFAIGFGKTVWSKETPETLYTVRAFPLGGFVRVRGMIPEEVEDPDGLYAKPVHLRFLVMIGGAMLNVATAFLLYVVIVGGWSPGTQVQIERVRDDSPAQAAGLQDGDVIVAVDGREYSGQFQTVGAIARNPGREVELTVRRGEEILTVPVTPDSTATESNLEALLYGLDDPEVRGVIGIDNRAVEMEPSRNPIEIVTWAGRHLREAMGSMVVLLKQLILRPERAKDSIGGPIMIAQSVHTAQQQGVEQLVALTAYLNVCFAFFNLLPIPMLDGSKSIIILIEGIRGKLFDKEREAMFHFVGLVALLVLAVFVAYMDVNRITGGGVLQ
jgi:regulator of sigma E protease